MPFDAVSFQPHESYVQLEEIDRDLAILRAARHRIRTPSLWCKGKLASANLHRVCLEGAVAYGALQTSARMTGRRLTCGGKFGWLVDASSLPGAWKLCALSRLNQQLPKQTRRQGGVPQFNDHTNTRHRDIIALLDRTIEVTEQERARLLEGQCSPLSPISNATGRTELSPLSGALTT